MGERDEVMTGLECCAHVAKQCSDCPYDDQRRMHARGEGAPCTSMLADDALALMEEKEAIKPHRKSADGRTWGYICGACKTDINPGDKYCHKCGRAVKWDD